ncbi:hypothetical protein SDJN02_24163, partial [Cucurbita argyrosperma subsp. argyrosperma]
MICDTSFLIFSTDSVVLGEWQQQLNHPSIVRWKNVRDIISEQIMAMPEQMKKTDMFINFCGFRTAELEICALSASTLIAHSDYAHNVAAGMR